MKSVMLILIVFVPALAFGGELKDLYWAEKKRQLEGQKTLQNGSVEKLDKQSISEIGLERHWAAGARAYTLIIKSDGTFRYSAGAYDVRYGEHTGTIDPSKGLETLFQLIEDSDYHSLQNTYEPEGDIGFHVAAVYTMVKTKGKTKVVYNIEESGPIKLWAIEKVIDSMLLNAGWDHKVRWNEEVGGEPSSNEKLAMRDPVIQALGFRSWIVFDRGYFGEALKTMESKIDKMGGDPVEVYPGSQAYNLGFCQYDGQKYKDAIVSLQRYIELSIKPEQAERFRGAYAIKSLLNARMMLTESFLVAENLDRAKDYFKEFEKDLEKYAGDKSEYMDWYLSRQKYFTFQKSSNDGKKGN